VNPQDDTARLQQTALDRWNRYNQSGDLQALGEAVAAFRAAADADGESVSLSNLSNALLAWYNRTGERSALDEAVEVGRAAVARASRPDAQAIALSNLSGALKASFTLTGDPALLDEATAVLRRGAALAADDPARGVLLSNLADALYLQYQRSQSLDALQEGVQALRQGLMLRMQAGPVPAGAIARLLDMLRICYERTGDENALSEAMTIGRQLASTAPAGSERAGWLSNVGILLRLRYQRTGEPDILREAVEAARAAVAEASASDQILRASILSNLGNTLRSGYEHTGEQSLLTEALDVLRQAVAATASGHPERAQILANLDSVLDLRYQSTGQVELLDERIRARREYLAAVPSHGAERSDQLASLAEVIRQRLEVKGEAGVLDDLVSTLREAWAAAPEGYPGRGVIGLNLGIALYVRFRAGANADTIAEAVRVLRAAVAVLPPGDADVVSARTNLAQALLSLYETSGDLTVLEEAISAGLALSADHPGPQADAVLADSLAAKYERTGDDDALRRSMALFGGPGLAAGGEAAPGEHPEQVADLPSWLAGPSRRANAWIEAYNSGRDLAALDRAVALWDRVLAHPWFGTLTPDIRAGALGGAGVDHLRRYNERSDNADLDEALRCCASSIEVTGHENYRVHVSNFSMALVTKYQRDGDMDSLVRAVELAQSVVRMTPEGTGDRADALTNLGGIWRRMREAAGDDAYLDAEVEVWEEAARIPVTELSKRGACLNNASVGLHDRYDARGNEDDLHRSIGYSRQALEIAPAGYRDASGWRSNLGNTLRHRYERTGVIADLDDAVEVLKRAVAEAPAQWQGRRECLTNLGSALRARARMNRSAELLPQALQAATEAMELTPVTSAEYDLYAANLAVGMGEVAAATGQPEYIDAQISLYEELLGRVPETAERRPWLQANLASALLNQPSAQNDPAVLDRVRNLIRASIARTAPGTAAFANRMSLLAGVLAAGGIHGPQAGEAERAFREACVTALDIAPAYALSTALQWALWCEDGQAWPTAVEAYHVAAEAADRLFATQIGRQDKEAWLHTASGMPAQAAFALVRTGQLEAAALTLERGRVRLLAEALGRNSAALDKLAEDGQGALAERFRAAQRRLGALEAGEASVTRGDVLADRMRGDDLASALAEHGAALAAIRRIPGYEHFLRPAEPGDLAEAADRPLVYLAAARLGGAALIVTRAEGGSRPAPRVELVELPKLTETAVQRQTIALQDARRVYDRDPGRWQGTLDAVCRWLWAAALGPLLDALGEPTAASLVPTGLLAALPLQAAWTEDDSHPTGRRYAADHLAITYAPSAGALLHARELAGQRPLTDLLGIADPQPVDAGSLPLAGAEVEAAAALLGVPLRDLRGPAADREHVLGALPGHSVVHFACHGRARPDLPMESALLMSGNTVLTLTDLFRLELAGHGRSGIRLAVLSACETQLPGSDLPDELVGLPSGFLQAGAAAVMASQWKITDIAAALVTAVFYRNLKSGYDGPAALRAAQVWLRDTTNGEKAAFMHPRTGQSGLPEAVARPLWRWLVTTPAQQRSFAEPSQWAAMTYTGA